MLSYFTHRPKKQDGTQDNDELKSPVLNEEDEKFLEKITSDEKPPPLPARPTVVLDPEDHAKEESEILDGADQVPLPTSPPADESVEKEEEAVGKDEEKKRPKYWSYIQQIQSIQMPNLNLSKNRSREKAAADLASAAEAVKEGKDLTQENKETEEEKEKRDLASILDGLHLGAINNRAFSFSKESQKLMEDFTQILKDIVNGVPTAYDDLEKLLTLNHQQLQKMYNNMPPFLQNLVRSLPAKMSTALAPELMAVMSEKPGADAKKMEEIVGDDMKKKTKRKIPSLKKVIKQQGVVAGTLKSILNFLKVRFPAFLTGTNILMSLAVFLLLFVFWYCHKRGRETRLEKERLAVGTESGDETASDMDASFMSERLIDDDPSMNDRPSESGNASLDVPLPSPKSGKEL